jgi:hypothetical protein
VVGGLRINKIFKQKSRNGSVGLKVSDIVARLLLESGRVSEQQLTKLASILLSHLYLFVVYRKTTT